MKKEAYKALGFKRLNIFNLWPSIFGKKSREMNSEAKKNDVGGNMAGDGMQNGGVLIVEKGGKLLLSFKQENASDHVENSEVLKALGLSAEDGASSGGEKGAEGGATGGPKVVCEEDVCRLEK
ncbi:prostamide/prostaglandin F synthase-like [Mya arenaria]|nr:prostamide/prostaglandin F synthase-like [Mya arenaria]